MGKAIPRRGRNRQKYTSRLARENPEKFRRECDKRLESAAGEAAVRARTLRDPRGRPVGTSFEVVCRALALLEACGAARLPAADSAGPTLAAETCAVLEDASTRSVAWAADPRLGKQGSGARLEAARDRAGSRAPAGAALQYPRGRAAPDRGSRDDVTALVFEVE